MADKQAIDRANAALQADPTWADLTRQILAYGGYTPGRGDPRQKAIEELERARRGRMKELGITLPEGTMLKINGAQIVEDHTKRNALLEAGAIVGGGIGLGAALGGGGAAAAGGAGAAAPGALSAPMLPAGLTTGLAPTTVGLGAVPGAATATTLGSVLAPGLTTGVAPTTAGIGSIPTAATTAATTAASTIPSAVKTGIGTVAPAVVAKGGGWLGALKNAAPLIMGGVKIAGDIKSGKDAEAATEKAGQQQIDSADKALALEKGIYEQTREDLTPYRTVGNEAMRTLGLLMGLGGGGAGVEMNDPLADPAADKATQLKAMKAGPGLTLRQPGDQEIGVGHDPNPNGLLKPAAPGTPIKPNDMSDAEWAAIGDKTSYIPAGQSRGTLGDVIGQAQARTGSSIAPAGARKTPEQMQTGSSFRRMRAPDGEEQDVPEALVPHLTEMGGTLVTPKSGSGLREGTLV